jgi:carboxypeptidase PM20D1
MSTFSIPDSMQIARNLSEAIKLETVSFDENSPAFPFEELHRLLERQYPLVHQHLKKEAVNHLSLLFTWQGTEPDLPPVAFLAHMDVVPADSTNWTHPAFSGDIADGFIWGRGVVDMKCQLITLMEAAETLLASGFKPRRTIYIALGHDEEIGGRYGGKMIAETMQKRKIKLDAVMDEGGSVSGGVAPGVSGLIATIAFAEKSFANVKLEATARAGHASVPSRTGAIGILSKAILRIEKNPMPANLEFVRPTIKALVPHLPLLFRFIFSSLWLTGGIVKSVLAQSPYSNAIIRNTIAATIVQGGYKSNVLPEKATATLNCRLLPGNTVEELLNHIRKVVNDNRVSVSCTDTSAPSQKPVSIETPYYQDLEMNIAKIYDKVPTCPILMMGATDSRHYQSICNSIYRFQPIVFHKPEEDRTHGIDERIEIEQLPKMVAFNARMMQSWGSR